MYAIYGADVSELLDCRKANKIDSIARSDYRSELSDWVREISAHASTLSVQYWIE